MVFEKNCFKFYSVVVVLVFRLLVCFCAQRGSEEMSRGNNNMYDEISFAFVETRRR